MNEPIRTPEERAKRRAELQKTERFIVRASIFIVVVAALVGGGFGYSAEHAFGWATVIFGLVTGLPFALFLAAMLWEDKSQRYRVPIEDSFPDEETD